MTSQARRKSIAIVGAGPIGLEAALYARALGHSPVIYDRGAAGENVRRWGFVKMFSPWRMNTSPLGRAEIAKAGMDLPAPEAFPTGRELIEHYLAPIAAALGGALRAGVEVAAVSRCGLLKGDGVGGKRRMRAPFRLLLRRDGSEEEAFADVVIDASGMYSNPCSLGDGGIPAVGEAGERDSIDYHLPDVRGAERSKFDGKTILLVGAGFSAATVLLELLRLRGENPATRVLWARRSTGPDPFPTYGDDPLAERARLAREGNLIARDAVEGCTVLSGVTVRAVTSKPGGKILVEFRPVDGGDLPEGMLADRIIANVGYRPSMEAFRELQVHHCYASEGPMALATALLGVGNEGDCLKQSGFGVEVMKNPEPGFFVVGHKSYGRRSDFLLRAGLEQVRDVFRILEDHSRLNLYGPTTASKTPGQV